MVGPIEDLRNSAGLTIIYDGECPFCHAYVGLVRLRDSVGHVSLIDARQRPDLVSAAKNQGFDLNHGMIAIYKSEIYWGEDAMTMLSSLSTPIGAVNRILASIFASPTRARLLYPLLRFGRNMTLKALSKTKL